LLCWMLVLHRFRVFRFSWHVVIPDVSVRSCVGCRAILEFPRAVIDFKSVYLVGTPCMWQTARARKPEAVPVLESRE
jgi:hypothetical protein